MTKALELAQVRGLLTKTGLFYSNPILYAPQVCEIQYHNFDKVISASISFESDSARKSVPNMDFETLQEMALAVDKCLKHLKPYQNTFVFLGGIDTYDEFEFDLPNFRAAKGKVRQGYVTFQHTPKVWTLHITAKFSPTEISTRMLNSIIENFLSIWDIQYKDSDKKSVKKAWDAIHSPDFKRSGVCETLFKFTNQSDDDDE